MVVLYSITAFVAITVSFISAEVIFSSGVPQVGVIENVTSIENFSFVSTVINIIPVNVINPILDRDLLQVIFIAVISGICINKLGDKVKLLNDLIKEVNQFCITLVSTIAAFIPVITFLAMVDMFSTLGTDSLLLLGRLLVCLIISAVAMVGVYSLAILTLCKFSPVPLLKKLPSFMMIPFATSSSIISMPFTVKFCTEKLGISPQIAAFSIPIGTTTNTNGATLLFTANCLLILKMYGVEITGAAIFTLFFSIFTVSIGTPGIVGGVEALMVTILGMFGVPATAVAIIFGIIPLADRIFTCSNVLGAVGVTTIIAANEKLIDKDIYFKA